MPDDWQRMSVLIMVIGVLVALALADLFGWWAVGAGVLIAIGGALLMWWAKTGTRKMAQRLAERDMSDQLE